MPDRDPNKSMKLYLSLSAVAFGLLALPLTLVAQQTHVVKNFNDEYRPESTTVVQGDTVSFQNPRTLPLTHQHDLNFDNNAYPGRGFASTWTHEIRFDDVGQFGFFCSRHGEQGTITVSPGNPGNGGPTFDMEPGLNGNWWNGAARDGEGVQVELSASDDDSMVFVATVYSYAPNGGQIFMIAVGTPSGHTADVDLFITDGGVWGAEFDPDTVTQTQWGTGTFTSESCESLHMELHPFAEYQAQGYTSLSYDLIRLTTPILDCNDEQ